jgi:hypothetical protein
MPSHSFFEDRTASIFMDTHPDVEERLVQGYRSMSPQEKLQRVVSLNRALDELAQARLRERYGENPSERDIRLRLAARYLDRETMIKVFHWDPDEHGF